MEDYLQWVPASNGHIPPSAVCGGVNEKGEKLYVARTVHQTDDPHNPTTRWPSDSFPGVVIPSRGVISYFTIKMHHRKQISTSNLSSKKYMVLTCTVPDILYWEPFKDYDSPAFQYNVISTMVSGVNFGYIMFFGKSDNPSTVHESLSEAPKEVCGPIAGMGYYKVPIYECGEHEWYADSEYLLEIHFHTQNTERLIETVHFSVLCAHEVPPLSHSCLSSPEVNWTTVCLDGCLPPNSFPTGISPTGEVLYLGLVEREGPTFANTMLTARDSLCSDTSVKCNVLTINDPSAVKWDNCSSSATPEAPVYVPVYTPEASIPYDTNMCIGRTLSNSDLTIGVSADHRLINLPIDRVTATQLVGVVRGSTRNLFIRWDDTDYRYLSYEVLVRKLIPKSLQHLCRNTIIIATLGIPNRVDQLLLPDGLKEFCKLTDDEKNNIVHFDN
ncbi:uncharacterized protein [Dysidea avara]|uniref:uncharacterized protein isoform X1 n=2 Tax=Dysidea avara TaxID=196820 RepID=UPI0033187EAB